ncbi:polysaccharide deacetylase family protein [Paenibacillus mucilaginosus]|uniref:Polysaccharide deacetylase n=2 Tax=Paenibacillus mucilaginosus TaxID=61624 RepID=H6NKB3_9BACL|nr:polysaccharide deacetylase family protein [Paenibacillus mucilaginosus]AEI44015.1 polysaccharide deacetylase [Paenibacillus mucilaginosus KNP414]AFC31597.1 polysaccharide deacetylase [Paenibacillus mucilaginosus 3016]MCG7212496.1 polysaccharide deacetylase family protein [Paenibacillus mucilaginosus]WDM25470.1 polysaccharide deacetylase family protein [Paenibacillus mucilaginosus]WFA20134.1 polysaccharide deacetylase [Paenibacillus mucilaginosus]
MPKVVVTFPEGKHKVLTLSYDDGRAADRRLIGILNAHGIKGTFHLNSGLLGTGDRLAAEEIAAQYRGHEVSAHTVTHPTIARSPKEQLVEEIAQDRRGLEQLVQYPVRGMSYPNGSYSRQIKELLPFLGIEYSRTVESTGGFGMPDDWHEWKPTCHHNGPLMSLAEQFAGLHKKQYLYMMYVWGHSYEFDNDNNWDRIERFCEYIGGREDIWYATNIEIVDYMADFRRLRFSADSTFVHNPSASSVWLQVDDRVVEVPGGSQVKLV